MPGSANPGARARAEAELLRDPARSDHLIAQLARCTPQRVSVWRRALERSGDIEHVKPAARAQRPRVTPFRSRARTAIEAGAQVPEQVMAFGLSYSAACAALARIQRRPQLPDAAAAADSLSVIRSPVPPRSAGRYRVSDTRPPAGYYRPHDEIELWCCTAEWTPTGWQHDRSCVLRLAAR